MILIDVNGAMIPILMGHISSDPNNVVTEDVVRYMFLSTILHYKQRFSKDYGTEIVLCADQGPYWRKEVFPLYKAHRKNQREESGFDWDKIFTYFATLLKEIQAHFPYKVIQIRGAEADDVIAALVREKSENYMNDGVFAPPKILIVSGDGDFVQLQKYKNVSQYSPARKKFLIEDKPHHHLMEKILKGDRGDGIPCFKAPDEQFNLAGVRQPSITQKNLDLWFTQTKEEICGDDAFLLRNFERNQRLIDLTFTPQQIVEDVIGVYKSQKPMKRDILNYFMKNRLRNLAPMMQMF